MHKTIISIACLGLIAAIPAMAGTEVKPKIVAFSASVKVEVDATGKPVKVEAPADLPQEIRTYIEKRVTMWHYEPAKSNGVPVAATTYVKVAACAIPSPAGDAFRLAADFDGNGPRYMGGKLMPPPQYPNESRRQGKEAEFVLILDIAADGKVDIGAIEKADISRPGRSGDFEDELRRWAKSLRFDPEQLAGSPVAGQVRMPVSFFMGATRDRKSLVEELEAKAKATRECQMAQGDSSMRPVAVNSVVKVTSEPAG